MTRRRDLRVALGPAAVLPVAEAVERLPWGREASRAWLDARELVRRRPDLPGPVVVWADVLDELRRTDLPAPPSPARATLRRVRL